VGWEKDFPANGRPGSGSNHSNPAANPPHTAPGFYFEEAKIHSPKPVRAEIFVAMPNQNGSSSVRSGIIQEIAWNMPLLTEL